MARTGVAAAILQHSVPTGSKCITLWAAFAPPKCSLILLGLAAWDWRANRRVDVFASALAVLAFYHLSVLTLYRVHAWSVFCAWFLSLPLS
jgi:hypothetical protein